MTRTIDHLNRELERLDPVGPGELEGALESDHATGLLEQILSLEVDPADRPRRGDDRPRSRRRLGLPKLAFAAVPAAAAAVAVLFIGLPGGGGSGDRLAGALDQVAAAAASQPQSAARPYTYIKTREMAVDETAADRRSWAVHQSTTREEWVAANGSGRLRTVSGPSRFIGPGDRAEWEAAGRPTFLALGFDGHTEHRWLAAGMPSRSVAELPRDPAALALRLRAEAKAEPGELTLAAATLQRLAEDLVDPAASPAVRRDLYEAAERVPGIEYLGERTDSAGRTGIAVGVAGSYAGRPALYSLIFDPGTSRVLATESTALGSPVAAGAGAPKVLRATDYLESRGIGSMAEFGQEWLTG
jgi:hypothetical protein